MMTALYILDLEQLSPARRSQLFENLPEERLKRIAACRHDADRLRIAGAGWLLQEALCRTGVPLQAQQFSQNPWGKPILTNREQVHFSLSHSGQWVVCCVSDLPAGVDVERPRCTPDVARRYFHPDELTAEDPVFLTRLWTAKEAFVKALGCGLTIPLDSFLVRLTPHRAELEQDYSPLPYRIHEYRLGGDLLCLCSPDDRPEPIWL